MRKPVDRRQPGTEAFRIQRHKPLRGDTHFYVPPTLESDFENWQMTDVPNVNYTFEVVRDWYAAGTPEYKPEYIRAMFFPIAWKSKIGNSDANSNFKTHHKTDVKKGDYVIREDGALFMLNWTVQRNANNQSTQAIECNAYLEFLRHIPEKVDSRGYLVEDAHDAVIAPEIPCIYAEYAGRPDYSPNYNAPGIAADHLQTVQVQYNKTTERIRINDEFVLLNQKYRIVNLVGSEIDIDRQYGILNQMAKRVAGDESDEWQV